MAAIANAGTGGIERRSNPRADFALREILSDSIRRSGKSREDVATLMSQLSGTTVSVNALNNFCAPGRETGRMPAILLPAFCRAVGDDRALRFLIGEELLRILELGEAAAALLGKPSALANAIERQRA